MELREIDPYIYNNWFLQGYQDSSKGNRAVFSTNCFGTTGYPPKKCWIDAEPPSSDHMQKLPQNGP